MLQMKTHLMADIQFIYKFFSVSLIWHHYFLFAALVSIHDPDDWHQHRSPVT